MLVERPVTREQTTRFSIDTFDRIVNGLAANQSRITNHESRIVNVLFLDAHWQGFVFGFWFLVFGFLVFSFFLDLAYGHGAWRDTTFCRKNVASVEAELRAAS